MRPGRFSAADLLFGASVGQSMFPQVRFLLYPHGRAFERVILKKPALEAARMKNKTNEAHAVHIALVTIVWNVILSIFKLFAGIFAGSAAMVSDAVHSASDVFSTIIVMIGMKVAAKNPDENHPYGHERFESVAAVVLAVILAATGVGIGYGGLKTIISGEYANLAAPGLLALIAAVISIAVKEWMYWYTRAAAKKINSGALMADAWHHRSDALSSVGSLVGIAGARLGAPVMDSVACLVICIFIIKAATDIFVDSMQKMTDTACDEAVTQQIREIVLEQEHVLGIDSLRTRLFGNRIYVDVDISANGSLTLFESHIAAQRVHDEVERRFPNVKHCMVHVSPFAEE